MPAGPQGNIVERLERLAETDPDRVVYIELPDGNIETRRITALELRDRAAAVADELDRSGVHHGDVVLLLAVSPIELLAGLFGCMRMGAIAAPLPAPRRVSHLKSRIAPVRENAGAVAVVAGPGIALGEPELLTLLAEGDLPVIRTDAATLVNPMPEPDVHRVAYLQYTSGSTSDPKGVVITHDCLVANIDAGADHLGIDESSVTVIWIPLSHDMGLVLGALAAVGTGSTSVILPPLAFIRDPSCWLRAMHRYRGTHTYAPNFAYELCVERTTPDQRAALDLSSVKVWLNGAEPVRVRTGPAFTAAFADSGADPMAWCPGYGLAEATVFIAATKPGRADVVWIDAAAMEKGEVVLREAAADGARALATDGSLAAKHEAITVDPITLAPADPTGSGSSGSAVRASARGYWRRAKMSAELFEARTADGDGPWLRTGDLAFIHEDQIVITGRAKDVIIIRGRNLYPQDIELVAEEAHPAVRAGGVASFRIDDDGTDAVVVVTETDEPAAEPDIVKAVKRAVLQTFEVPVADVYVVGPRWVPKTTSGKTQRTASHDRWREERGIG